MPTKRGNQRDRSESPAGSDGEEGGGTALEGFEGAIEKQRLKGMRRRDLELERAQADGSLERAKHLHLDDLSSDDEEAVNTIGNVPLHWYEEHDHIGYTLDGKRLQKSSRGDGLDRYLASQDDPNYRRTVYDAYNDREVVLTDRQMQLIRNVMKGNYAHPEFNDTPDYVPIHSHKVQVHAMGSEDEPKRRFVPSKWERKRVMKIVAGIKSGRIKINEEKQPKPEAFLLWGDDNTTGEDSNRKGPPRLPPPKPELPGHAASYNPPKEYLPSEEEKKEWLEMDPEDRPQEFMPQGFDSLRLVPRYDQLCKERFDRCLDLHMAPRAKLNKLNINPDSLLPRLPSVTELKPFPNAVCVTYKGVHEGRVRALSTCPSAQWLVSGGEDGKVALWEVLTGRCVSTLAFDEPITALKWNPRSDRPVVAVASGTKLYLLNSGAGTEAAVEAADGWLQTAANADADSDDGGDGEGSGNAKQQELVAWKQWNPAGHGKEQTGFFRSGVCIQVHNATGLTKLAWHMKGDYMATLSLGSAKTKAVLIHQVSKRSSRAPFTKDVSVQAIDFHPTKPFFFVASQTNIRIYNLQRQKMIKKLRTGAKWISSISIHPKGDHVIVGTYDKRLCWFDLDLSDRPFKTLKYHDKGIRAVAFHKFYPLMASASDDGSIHVFHARVYDDLMQNPLIIPVKILKGHKVSQKVGVMDVEFHPTLPWLFSCGSDGVVQLWQNL
jgi:ribosome biogenesis protein ERB1